MYITSTRNLTLMTINYIYCCGLESLQRNGVAIIVNKRVQNAVLDTVSKMTEWSLFIPKANHSVSQYSKSIPHSSNVEEADIEHLYEHLQDILELTP